MEVLNIKRTDTYSDRSVDGHVTKEVVVPSVGWTWDVIYLIFEEVTIPK